MTETVDLTSPSLYLNRELSLLEFQRRVLEEAWDESKPLLERIKFLAIFGSNMDEFFMVRVSGIRKMVEARIMEISPDGRTPPDQLAAIRKFSILRYSSFSIFLGSSDIISFMIACASSSFCFSAI